MSELEIMLILVLLILNALAKLTVAAHGLAWVQGERLQILEHRCTLRQQVIIEDFSKRNHILNIKFAEQGLPRLQECWQHRCLGTVRENVDAVSHVRERLGQLHEH